MLGELANIFRESQIQDYVEVADEIGKNKEALLMDVQKAIEEFICLLENWEELIEKAWENPYELSKK